MKVIVDFDACQCMAMCAVGAPEVFEITDEGLLAVKLLSPPESLREAVERAVRECPTHAISIEES